MIPRTQPGLVALLRFERYKYGEDSQIVVSLAMETIEILFIAFIPGLLLSTVPNLIVVYTIWKSK